MIDRRARFTRGLVAVIALVLLAGPTNPALGQAGDGPSVDIESGQLEHHGRTYNVDFMRMRVPMNRRDPASRSIELRFIRYKSPAKSPKAPIVYLAGGPGGTVIGTLGGTRGRMLLSFIDERDFIAFDQRGTGQSEPRNLVVFADEAWPMDEPLDPTRACAIYQATATKALAVMRERDIDVRGFTTEESADDLEAVRKAVGAEQLVLWGSSYGTHLALATARRHPTSVAALVLAGTEGPDHTLKLPSNIQRNLAALGALVRQDPVYAELMPDLNGTVQTVLADLEQNPRTVTIIPGFEIAVGVFDLQRVLSQPMGSRSQMQRLPASIYAMSHGEFFDLANGAIGSRQLGSRSAMSLIMDCASYATEARLERVQRESLDTLLGAAIDYPLPCACEVEGMPRLGDDFRGPLVSDIPALFISGTLDGRTPVSNAEEIAAGFSNHQHLVIRNAAHGQDLFTSAPAIRVAVDTFLRGETIPTRVIDGPTWTFSPPYQRSLPRIVLELVVNEGWEEAAARAIALRDEYGGGYVYNFRPSALNGIGYRVVQADLIDLAIGVFHVNTALHPDAFKPWDSLGEAYLTKGELEPALAHYQKSLALNPENEGAQLAIERIRADLELFSTPGTDGH